MTIDCGIGLERNISAQIGALGSHTGNLEGMGLEHDFLPMRAMLIAQREQLFFEKQANNCIFFSAISPDSDRYSPLPPRSKTQKVTI